MEPSHTEVCANCYQMLDKHRLVHRAFTCSKCGAIAVECRRCAEIAVERELSGISTCAKCNIEEETRD